MKASTSRIVWLKVAIFGALMVAMAPFSLAKLEREQLAIESQLQNRIENILSKTLPPNSFLVTVKVEMDTRTRPTTTRSSQAGKGRNNPFERQSQFVLPGVPQKKEFVLQQEQPETETTLNAFESETLVRRILITILVAPDVPSDQIRGLQEIIQSSIPFNPIRGDEIEIKNSSLLKPINTPSPSANAKSSDAGASAGRASTSQNSFASWFNRNNAPLMIVLGAIATIFFIFLAFLFGPVRTFLNKLLAVLPRVGEQAAYAVNNAPAKPQTNVNGSLTMNGRNGVGGGGHSNNPHEPEGPFSFIREEQLSKLPILLRQMAPAQAAIVLAYLPPEWASKMLSSLDGGAQSSIMRELSQAREVPAETVKEVEALVKSKLPYLVGGVDWVQSVYQMTQPQTQRALLGTLAQQAPDLAQNLRKKTFFFEDMAVIAAGSMRMVVAEVGYPVLAQAIRAEKPEFRAAVLQRLPAATREIVLQELELSGDDKVAATDAKMKIMALGQRLLTEGRIQLPERK